MKIFKITGEWIELSKLLKASGICSTGGQAKTVIAQGYVRVDKVQEKQKGKKIRPGQQVEFQNEVIQVEKA